MRALVHARGVSVRRACVRACARVRARACARARACVRARVRECVLACVHLRVCSCMRVHVRGWVDARIGVRTCASTGACGHACVCKWVYLCLCLCVCGCVCVCMCVGGCAWVYVCARAIYPRRGNSATVHRALSNESVNSMVLLTYFLAPLFSESLQFKVECGSLFSMCF